MHPEIKNTNLQETRDFFGSPMVKTSPSNAGDVGSTPAWGTKIPYASWPKDQNIKKKKKKKQYCNKFNKHLKNGPHKKFFKLR